MSFRTDVDSIVRELATGHELLFAFVRRDLSVRYKQALLGIAWAVISPVLQMLVFTIVFTRVVQLDTGMPYPVYAYAGLLPWMLFAGAVRSATTSLTANAALLTKVFFAREVLPLSSVLVGLFDFLVASSVLAGLMAWFRVGVTWTALALPVILMVELAFTAGTAFLFAMANLFYRDFRHLTDVLLTTWMLCTSVVYPVDRVGGILGRVLRLNPMTPIIDAYRAVLLRGELPAALPFLGASLAALVLLIFGWLAFHRAEPRFSENV